MAHVNIHFDQSKSASNLFMDSIFLIERLKINHKNGWHEATGGLWSTKEVRVSPVYIYLYRFYWGNIVFLYPTGYGFGSCQSSLSSCIYIYWSMDNPSIRNEHPKIDYGNQCPFSHKSTCDRNRMGRCTDQCSATHQRITTWSRYKYRYRYRYIYIESPGTIVVLELIVGNANASDSPMSRPKKTIAFWHRFYFQYRFLFFLVFQWRTKRSTGRKHWNEIPRWHGKGHW